jgi:DNA polymerase III epsilon subunit-like protein
LKKRIAAEAENEKKVTTNRQNHTGAGAEEKQDGARQKRQKLDKSVPRMTINEALQLQKAKSGEKADSTTSVGSSSTVAYTNEVPKSEQCNYVGLDCEMVGVGANGKASVLARACIVDYEGQIIYDAFVKVDEHVTDFRTKFSGVRPKNLKSKEAVSFEKCAEDVAKILKGKVLVGHALHNDLKVLMLSHPRHSIRDTAKYRPFMRYVAGKFKPRKLRDLAKEHLNLIIQTGEHTPDEDAKAAMMLYRAKRAEWENSVKLLGGGKLKRKAT